jgi:hypothetical protein
VTASCVWSSTSATIASFAVDADCPVPTVSGNLSAPATKIPAAIAPRLLPGKYSVLVNSNFLAGASTSGNSTCSFEVYDGTTSGGRVTANEIVNVGRGGVSTIVGQFEYTSTQTNKQFEVRVIRNTGNGSCLLAADTADLTFTLIPLSQGLPQPFIPSSVFAGRSSVVKDAFFSLNCDSGSAILTNEDGAINTIANISTGTCAVTFVSGYWTSTPLCVGTRLSNTNDRNAYLTGITSSGFTMRGVDGSTESTAFDMSIFCRASQ